MKKQNSSHQENHAAASTIGLSRMVKITNRHADKLENLIANTIRTLEEYRHDFHAAAAEGDKEALETLIHKGTMTIFYIEAEKLDSLMQQTREVLEERPAPSKVLDAKIQETDEEFTSVIQELKTVRTDDLLERY